jgi:hypothetical protein
MMKRRHDETLVSNRFYRGQYICFQVALLLVGFATFYLMGDATEVDPTYSLGARLLALVGIISFGIPFYWYFYRPAVLLGGDLVLRQWEGTTHIDWSDVESVVMTPMGIRVGSKDGRHWRVSAFPYAPSPILSINRTRYYAALNAIRAGAKMPPIVSPRMKD